MQSTISKTSNFLQCQKYEYMNSLPGSEDNLLIKCIGFPENNTIIKHKILLQRSEQHQLSLFYFLYTLFTQQQQKTFASH